MSGGKLVRDRIPELMRESGESISVEQLTGMALGMSLRLKLVEEAEEALEASGKDLCEELADVLEVVHALASAAYITDSELLAARKLKRIEKGGFERGYFVVREGD